MISVLEYVPTVQSNVKRLHFMTVALSGIWRNMLQLSHKLCIAYSFNILPVQHVHLTFLILYVKLCILHVKYLNVLPAITAHPSLQIISQPLLFIAMLQKTLHIFHAEFDFLDLTRIFLFLAEHMNHLFIYSQMTHVVKSPMTQACGLCQWHCSKASS